ncbi:MAG: DNA topoisomerase IB [Altererythrobacter sp.]|nr:DNA topoisomerase IB [Altererythrobacter sp.]OJU59511.1 MAG: DNA topoisomerase [Altererythrobacter sp. 66-12]
MAVKPPALDYVDDGAPGITRKKAGRHWAYFDPAGQRITDRDEIDRLNRIALPPAYVQAWFCPSASGHLLATGIDARGRKQYRYHPDYRTHREAAKFDHCAAFGCLLPKVRRRVADDLARHSLSRERVVASVVRLLDLGAIRVGNESYAKANSSFGATTLRQRHAAVSGGKVKLRFRAKSGQLREATIDDARLARLVRRMQDLPGQHLFQYVNGDGEAHPVGSHDVNAYLCETMGEHFTAKDFRTWHASALALRLLAEAERPLTLKELTTQVGRHLGNTPAMARKSYIHPAVIALVARQRKWRATLKLPRETKWLSRYERALVTLLENSPKAKTLLAA